MDVLARYEGLVDDYEAFRAACDRPQPYTVRINPLKTTVDRVTAALDEAGVDWHVDDRLPFVLELDTDAPGLTWPHYLGWVQGQEAVSTLPAHALDLVPGQRVWDACAAPGSKTGQLAGVLEDEGRVVANDVNLGRLAALRSNLDRLGVTCAAVTNQDGRTFTLAPFDDEPFDRTLVDAPCSGEGTVRKNPAALDDWSEGFLDDVVELQVGLLRRAVQATREGGIVVYSTCTFAPEENEAVLDRVLAAESCRLEAFDCPLEAEPGVTAWDGARYDEQVRRAQRLWPHLNDTGGFFLARLRVGA